MTTKKAIADLRRTVGLSQRGFAEKIGTTVETISRWERGRREPNRQALERLSVIAHESGLAHLGDFFFRSAQASIIGRVKGLKSRGSERHVALRDLKYWSAYLYQTWKQIGEVLENDRKLALPHGDLIEYLRNIAGVLDHIRDRIELYIDDDSSDRLQEDEEILRWGHSK